MGAERPATPTTALLAAVHAGVQVTGSSALQPEGACAACRDFRLAAARSSARCRAQPACPDGDTVQEAGPQEEAGMFAFDDVKCSMRHGGRRKKDAGEGGC